MRVLLLFLCVSAATSAEPVDARVALAAAKKNAGAGRTQAAVQQLRTLIRSGAPADVTGAARLELVRIYERQQDWFRAAGQLAELRKLAPDETEYAYRLGIAYRNLSRWAFVRMREIAPEAARVKQMEAEQYAGAGDSARAIRRYRDALAADPKLPGSHLGLAMLYARSGKKAEALAEIEQELALAPQSAVARQVRQMLGAGAP